MKYRSKVEEFDAVKWTGDMSAIIALVGQDLPTYGPPYDGALRIPVAWSDNALLMGDYLVKHPTFGLIAFPAAVIERDYEPVEES